MDWIKVEDQLPEVGQVVLYYFKHTGRSLGKYYGLSEEPPHEPVFGGRDGWLTADVTHWIPVPDPPVTPDRETASHD